MIIIKIRNKDKETALVRLLQGEFIGRMYVNFPIKGLTRKERKSKLYRVQN